MPTITHRCGHTADVPQEVPEEKAGWLAGKDCRACWLARQRAREQVAARHAARHGFPPLTGSPAQIPWAEAVRQRLIAGLDRALREGRGNPERLASTRAFLLSQREAKWWIDHRALTPSQTPRLRHAPVLAALHAAFQPLRRA
jgi:hypothetical protein